MLTMHMMALCTVHSGRHLSATILTSEAFLKSPGNLKYGILPRRGILSTGELFGPLKECQLWSELKFGLLTHSTTTYFCHFHIALTCQPLHGRHVDGAHVSCALMEFKSGNHGSWIVVRQFAYVGKCGLVSDLLELTIMRYNLCVLLRLTHAVESISCSLCSSLKFWLVTMPCISEPQNSRLHPEINIR